MANTGLRSLAQTTVILLNGIITVTASVSQGIVCGTIIGTATAGLFIAVDTAYKNHFKTVPPLFSEIGVD